MEGDREQGVRLEAVLRRIACEDGGEKLVIQERRAIMNTWDQRRSCRLVVEVKAEQCQGLQLADWTRGSADEDETQHHRLRHQHLLLAWTFLMRSIASQNAIVELLLRSG
jgi:hypothetical protein